MKQKQQQHQCYLLRIWQSDLATQVEPQTLHRCVAAQFQLPWPPPHAHSPAHPQEHLLSSSSCPDHFHSQMSFPTPVVAQRCRAAEPCCRWQHQRTEGLSLKEKSTLRHIFYMGLRCLGITVRREVPVPGTSSPAGPRGSCTSRLLSQTTPHLMSH